MNRDDNRMTAMGMNVLISVLGAAALLVMTNYLSGRHYVRADWTASRMYTLSDKSRQVVTGLKKDVTLHVLWSKADPLFGQLEELLKGYEALSARLHVAYCDPDEDPEQFSLIASRYGKAKVNELGQEGFEAGVFAVSGDNVRFLPADGFQQFGDDEGLTDETPELSFVAESEITSALINVTAARQQTICFTQGHGEWAFDGGDRDSLRHIRKELSLSGFESTAVNLLQDGTAFDRCDAVVVAGPKKAFSEKETATLSTALRNGGRLLLLLDPVFEDRRFLPTGLESLTAEQGISLRSDFVLETDPRRLPTETPVTFIADRFYNHGAVKPLAKDGPGPLPVVFSAVRSLFPVEKSEVVADELVATSDMSFGETDLATLLEGGAVPEQDALDADGPLTIAMAAVRGSSDGGEASRLVVVGDSDFLSEELFANAGLYNQDFFSSIVGWLTQRRDMVSIAPRNPEQIRLALTDSDFGDLLVTLLMEVLLILMAGGLVIYRRRK